MTIPLAEQIKEAKREHALRVNVYKHRVAQGAMDQAEADRHLANMSAIITTLEWLAENEAKIKAKVQTVDQHDAEPLGKIESTNTYRLGNAIFLDMAKGGYEQRYKIVDEAGAEIGTKIVGCKTRSDKPYTIYEPYGFMCFQTAKAFIEAYERGDWKAKEAAPA